MKRCAWVGADPLYVDYHDTEWGVPLHDDRRLFEFLVLEAAQAGLSWITILRKRENYRKAFADFDPEAVARFNRRSAERLLQDAGIVRNRQKIAAAIGNARAFLAVQDEFRVVRPVRVALRRRPADPGPLAYHARRAREDARVGGDVEGPLRARLPVRGAHDLLCAHAGDRDGQRPPARLLPLCAGAQDGWQEKEVGRIGSQAVLRRVPGRT